MLSVTQVLDYLKEPELVAWLLRTSPAKRKQIQEEALTVGTAVDEWIKADIEGKLPLTPCVVDAQVTNCLLAWGNFKRENTKFKELITHTQGEVVCDDIIGHPDLVIKRPDSWGIVDIKTSKAINPRYWTQTAQYSEMWRKKYDLPGPRFIAILRFDKNNENGLYEYKEIADEAVIQYEIGVFQAYLTAYHHNWRVREIIREQLEKEVLGCS